MLIDTHCHLDAAEFDVDRDKLMSTALSAGVGALVVPAVAPDNFIKVRACAERYSHTYPAYGTHPLYVARVDEIACIAALRAWLKNEMSGSCAPVAVGEIGLDFYVPGFDVALQERIFIQQLKIARDFDLPVLLHVRRAVDAVLKCLRRIGVRGGIAHAFNGSRQQADEFLHLGFRLGFGGTLTFPRATRIRALATDLPAAAIVLETDAPDISPVWLAGGRNTPAELGRIAGTLADLRGVSGAEVARFTSENAIGVLRLQVRIAPQKSDLGGNTT